ncbi:MAG: hypothetical protein U1G07_14485 [Verrucomicrobiota bacterium]
MNASLPIQHLRNRTLLALGRFAFKAFHGPPRSVRRAAGRARFFTAGLTLLSTFSVRAQLVIEVPVSSISVADPTLIIEVVNQGNDALSLGGVNFSVTIGGGTAGPTMDTTLPSSPQPASGVDLLSGLNTLFTGNPLGQFAVGTPDPRSQTWSVLALSPVSLDPGERKTLATLNFNSVPLGGPFALSFVGTSFADAQGATVNGLVLPETEITIVPEPAAAAVACGLALFAVAAARKCRGVFRA